MALYLFAISLGPKPIARGKSALHLRSITPCQKRCCIQPGKLLSHLGRMPSLRRARSGSGQNLQKSTQVEASGEANSSNDPCRIERPSIAYPAASPF